MATPDEPDALDGISVERVPDMESPWAFLRIDPTFRLCKTRLVVDDGGHVDGAVEYSVFDASAVRDLSDRLEEVADEMERLNDGA